MNGLILKIILNFIKLKFTTSKVMKKKILVFTGSRADYGILRPLVFKLKKEKKIDTLIAASTHHFSKNYGNTYKQILNDFKKINYKCKININKTSINSIINYCGKSIVSLNSYINKVKPSMIIILGDRYETFICAFVGFMRNIPISHIHGGEITKGAIDDSLRHAITKLSDYHFVCHENYKKRIIQLGENSKNIFNYGSLSSEEIKKFRFESKKNLIKKNKIPNFTHNILVTFHPETRSNTSPKKQIEIFIRSIENFDNILFIITYNNKDESGDYFRNRIKKMKKNKNIILFESLGVKKYFNFLKFSDIVIGNSSSGIIEAPIVKTPTINVGSRQDGREFSKSIFNVPLNHKLIKNKINEVLNLKKVHYQNLFFKKNASNKISKKIISLLNHKNEIKSFKDIKVK